MKKKKSVHSNGNIYSNAATSVMGQKLDYKFIKNFCILFLNIT